MGVSRTGREAAAGRPCGRGTCSAMSAGFIPCSEAKSMPIWRPAPGLRPLTPSHDPTIRRFESGDHAIDEMPSVGGWSERSGIVSGLAEAEHHEDDC
jgi:hypothetical protein